MLAIRGTQHSSQVIAVQQETDRRFTKEEREESEK
jgi:hypothetical protein